MSEYAKVHIHVNIQLNMQLYIGHSLNIREFFRCCYLTGREMEVQLSLIGIGPVLYWILVNMQVNIREYSVNFSEFLAGLRPAAYAGH